MIINILCTDRVDWHFFVKNNHIYLIISANGPKKCQPSQNANHRQLCFNGGKGLSDLTTFQKLSNPNRPETIVPPQKS
jgi:hypothetical protein